MQVSEKFLDSIYQEFDVIQKTEQTDITVQNKFATLEDHIKAKLITFDNVKRPDLYRLSKLIEDHAQRAYEPLIATFEAEHLYKYVEKHYLELMKNIPMTWVIGGFDNPFFAPQTPPEKAEVLTCAGTNLQNMWIVISKGPDGLFGLVAEDVGGVQKGDHFRGFFTSKQDIIKKVIEKINESLMTHIDFFELEK
ncbi:hypothetical protein C6990_07710 [Nitrosopumilus sp. b3]|uniref:hypothetical protein n=1 Tax=Nitrosopumilus sp. b3 TaxID=2109909 RepID=UPI0015F5BC86|nr:hypothetical protein [Nitrosopumilus sp. b3]KAF6246961.1 hypothetical protein C6990_07710 [Nitrosopumilus sp. b3]